jgi:Ca-activated chloride channel family protein
MSFLHPQLLWLLLAPALLLVLALRPARSTPAAYPKIPHARLRHSSFVLSHWSFSPRPIFAAFALALLVTALARPQGGEIATPAVVRARDVLVAVDVSRSMLAADVAPSRLERARLLVRSLADELQGERLGLLPFAGSAFLQSPLSVDYGILRTFLDELGPDMIPAGGSDFTALLTVADEAFGPAPSSPDAPPASDRYLIVLSDGEAQDETWRAVAQKLADRGVRVITLGLGTAAGAMIPDGKGGLVKDERGAVVLSRLEASTLRELARLTDGAYRDASAWIDLPALLRETVARGRATESIEENSVRRAELFRWFLAPALALLILSLVREFPVTLRPRALKLARAALWLVVFHWSFVIGHSSFAAPNPARAAEPDPLVDLVTRLSTQATLPAADLARLATLSAERGEADPALPKGVLRDALAAVSAGEKSSPQSADWPALRQRLETLLNPPPPPEQPEPPKPEDQSPPPEEKSEGEKPEPEKSPSDQTSGSPESKSADDSSDSPGTPSPGSAPSDSESSSSPPKPSSESLGELKDGEPQPAPSDEKSPEPEPTQRAGGVSASGQPREASETAATDPALAIPQQRLDRVRDADSPAQLFKLIQDSELPPDARERAAAGRTRDW